jgi:hypothetical protein
MKAVKEREPTANEIKQALARPSDFGLDSDHEHYDEMFSTWSLGDVIRTRDSSIAEESNADALEKILNDDYPELSEDWTITRCNHWAVGWVEHLSFRVFDADGKTPSKIFRVLCGVADKLANYPLLDEDDVSRREYEDTLENIESAGRQFLKDNPPDDWASQCFSWFWESDQHAVECRDGNGGYPSDDEMKACLKALGLLDPECDDEEDEEEGAIAT